jgi:hypothetical protein
MVSAEEMDEAFWDAHKKSNSNVDEAERKRGAYLKNQYSPQEGQIVRFDQEGGPTFYWFANRKAPEADVKDLAKLKGHLTKGMFLTKFRKSFLKHEMNDDLDMVTVGKGKETEYIRILPQSPP